MQVQPAYAKLLGARVRIITVQKERRQNRVSSERRAVRNVIRLPGQGKADPAVAAQAQSKRAVRASIDAFLNQLVERARAQQSNDQDSESVELSLPYVSHMIDPLDPRSPNSEDAAAAEKQSDEDSFDSPDQLPTTDGQVVETMRLDERDETVVRTHGVVITEDGVEHRFTTEMRSMHTLSTSGSSAVAGAKVTDGSPDRTNRAERGTQAKEGENELPNELQDKMLGVDEHAYDKWVGRTSDEEPSATPFNRKVEGELEQLGFPSTQDPLVQTPFSQTPFTQSPSTYPNADRWRHETAEVSGTVLNRYDRIEHINQRDTKA